jgi:hypothetical protein
MTGALSPAGDGDFFSFAVPVGAQRMSLRTRTYSVAGDPLSVCDDTIDTRLRLYTQAGLPLEDNDDINTGAAVNRCSFIDGTARTIASSGSDMDPNARNLAPGIYVLRVSYYSDVLTGTTETYFLEIELVQE